MSRCLTIVVAVVIAVPMASSAPKPKDGMAPTAYVPTTVGDKWVEVTYNGPYKHEYTLEVTVVEQKDGDVFVTIQRRGGLARKLKASERGLFLLEEGKFRYDPPICLLPMPVKEGDKWTWEKPGISKMTFTAGKEEEVEVPAGKFKAIRIDGVGDANGTPIKCSNWMVPGRGVIKSDLRLGDDELTEALKSFTPGKK